MRPGSPETQPSLRGKALAIATGLAAVVLGHGIQNTPQVEGFVAAVGPATPLITPDVAQRKTPKPIQYLDRRTSHPVDPSLPFQPIDPSEGTTVTYLGDSDGEEKRDTAKSASPPVIPQPEQGDKKATVHEDPAEAAPPAQTVPITSPAENTPGETATEQPQPGNEENPSELGPMPKTVSSAQEAVRRFYEPGNVVIPGLVAAGGDKGTVWYQRPVIVTYADGVSPIILYTETAADGQQIIRADISVPDISELQIYGTADGTPDIALTYGDVQCAASTTGLDNGECRDSQGLVFGQKLTRKPDTPSKRFRLLNKAGWYLTPLDPTTVGPKG